MTPQLQPNESTTATLTKTFLKEDVYLWGHRDSYEDSRAKNSGLDSMSRSTFRDS